ncbi:DUF1572 family protein [Flavobacterium sp. NKUCC04_CG]|uniref:DUF1572 family protein n=1 Tax=Flavobacterium sp. NKUCC04_CG TaxID=2842121 RepID=UPI001C5B2CD8|nr:DUF1572 family protein [Flavobacterium sp. NKUCC04_CG]MBW3520034.1 DUF1572 domain-containing protein [Flavobacterium sp. NKUCC04_CG]
MNTTKLDSIIKQLEYYRLLGDKTILILSQDQLNWTYNETSNSIAMLINHISGNMLSRWTDFLTTDGEKPYRNRDAEFAEGFYDRHELIKKWDQGWDCMLDSLRALTDDDLDKNVVIRGQEQSAFDAIIRQVSHYPYHIGQIVFEGKMLMNTDWQSLSIPKGGSLQYNDQKFSNPNTDKHFTDDFLKK